MRVWMSQARATSWVQVPMLLRNAPIQRRRKFRNAKAERKPGRRIAAVFTGAARPRTRPGGARQRFAAGFLTVAAMAAFLRAFFAFSFRFRRRPISFIRSLTDSPVAGGEERPWPPRSGHSRPAAARPDLGRAACPSHAHL